MAALNAPAAHLTALTVPDDDNEAFWELVKEIVNTAGEPPLEEGSFTTVDLSNLLDFISMEVQDNAPRNTLANAITRAVNEDNGGTWTSVDLSVVREFIVALVSQDGCRLRCSETLNVDR